MGARTPTVPTEQPKVITRLLHEVSSGDHAAEGALLEQVYDQLRAIAQQRMAHERPGHTLQATALVHEAYLRMLGDTDPEGLAWRDRGHFYRAAAEAMRRILVDHARRRNAGKRGGDRSRTPLINVCDLASHDNPEQILSLDSAIVRLQEADASAADIVRLRFFAGLSVDQTAAALGLSESTVKREWSYIRAKLFRMMEESSKPA